jgi:putative oxidoreductase
MATFMRPFEAQTYALMRIIVGFLFLWHGSQKLFGWPLEVPPGAPPAIIYSAGSIELVGGALIMIGLFTRWAAFICSGTMAFAYWLAHGTKAPLPIVNQGELAVIYCFVVLYIAARGAGIWSVDDSGH